MKRKFRAWYDGKMTYSHNNSINSDNQQLSWFFNRIHEDAITMQFTGLLDKNGKEIYEGDIIKTRNNKIGEVTWLEDGFYVQILRSCEPLAYAVQMQIEVICNIYENPDLI